MNFLLGGKRPKEPRSGNSPFHGTKNGSASTTASSSSTMAVRRNRAGGATASRNGVPASQQHRRPTPGTAVPRHHGNSFLMGGQYYPQKDKKRKRSAGGSSHQQLKRLARRIFWSSPRRRLISLSVLGLFFLGYIVLPRRGSVRSSLRRKQQQFDDLADDDLADDGTDQPARALWKRLYLSHHHRMQEDGLLLNFPTLQQERQSRLQLVSQERLLLHESVKSTGSNSQQRQQDAWHGTLAKIVPDWFHRNHPQVLKHLQERQQQQQALGEDEEAESVEEEKDATAGALMEHEKEQDEAAEDDNTNEGEERNNTKSAAKNKDAASQQEAEERGAHTAVHDQEQVDASAAKNLDSNKSHEVVSATTKNLTVVSAKEEVPADQHQQLEESQPAAPGHLKEASKSMPVLRTLETMHQFSNRSSCHATTAELHVTLAIQSSLDRLWILEETCQRWKEPIVAVVALAHASSTQGLQSDWKSKCSQLHLIPYVLSEQDSPYPVNRLRNMALDVIKTSHVLMVDIDFVPSIDLHVRILKTLKNETSNKQALVVPAFERLLDPPCTTSQDCQAHLQGNSSFVPRSLPELRDCVRDKNCRVFQSKENWEGHYSTHSNEWLRGDWYQNTTTARGGKQMAHKIDCFHTLRYEPYVVIQWCPSKNDVETASSPMNSSSDLSLPVAPYYDERFYGYGKNKIQYISHLRFLGYQFAVLPKGFIVHNPHPDSHAKQTWNNMTADTLHHDMDALYPQFLEELVAKYFVDGRPPGYDIVMPCQKKHGKTAISHHSAAVNGSSAHAKER